jgi:hypothetical protein
MSVPAPDPALKVFDVFIGTWDVKGQLLGPDGGDVVGRATYTWLPGGFFLQQDVELDFAGLYEVKGRELIGYDAETKTFPSTVFSSLSPVPIPYRWQFDGRRLKITVDYPPLDATFEGELGEDGNSFSGGWRPNPGADETVNVAYDVAGTRA